MKIYALENIPVKRLPRIVREEIMEEITERSNYRYFHTTKEKMLDLDVNLTINWRNSRLGFSAWSKYYEKGLHNQIIKEIKKAQNEDKRTAQSH